MVTGIACFHTMKVAARKTTIPAMFAEMVRKGANWVETRRIVDYGHGESWWSRSDKSLLRTVARRVGLVCKISRATDGELEVSLA